MSGTYLIGFYDAVHVTNADGTVSLVPGFPVSEATAPLAPAALMPSLVADDDEAILAPAIGAPAALSLLPARVASDDTIATATLSASVVLSAGLVDDAETIYAPGPSRTLLPSLITATDSVFPAAKVERVKPGKETRLRPGRLDDADAVYAFGRSVGPVSVLPQLVAADDAIPAADVGRQVIAELTTDVDEFHTDIDIELIAFIVPEMLAEDDVISTYPFFIQKVTGGIPVPDRISLTGSISQARRLRGSTGSKVSLKGSMSRRRELHGSMSVRIPKKR